MSTLNMDNIWMDTAGLSLWENWRAFIAAEPMKIFEHSTPVEVIEELAHKGYADRIVFGSDEPYTDYAMEISLIERADIRESDKKKIFHENIEGLLK